ncbi:histidinol-phosphatase [Jatrophihabitans sp.]|uniref:histidinol-phosphatase n=1 Tax=Jatrophihabitans sp. TaxID=1932789 RepID=UPI0030C71171|nr:Histidinol-phosphate phosphatase [Jatrophihabitans sp.]
MASPYSDDLELALSLADAADLTTMERFGAVDLVVESKPDLTPVSDADRSVERAIRSTLTLARPDDAVSGEEFGSEGSGSRRWVVDPIDGTKNFIRGVPVWATLIALLDGDEAVMGVVSAPALGRRWWAAQGDGAYGTALGSPPRRLQVSRVAALSDASLSFASLGGWAARGSLDAFVGLTQSVWRTRGFGDFWSYMLLAEGAVDVAAEPELSLWDMAALAPVVTEAGGRFTGLNGVDGIHQGNAAASNGTLHAALLDAIGD